MSDPSLPLFYKSPRVLTPASHGNRSLRSSNDYRFAAKTNAMPLVAEEIPLAARHYPVVLSDQAPPHPQANQGQRARLR